MNKLYTAVFILTLLTLQGCKNSQASSASIGASDPASASTAAERPVGCHPMRSSLTPVADGNGNKPPTDRVVNPIPDDMVFIRGGSFAMGTADGIAVEAPIHQVSLNSFWIDRHEVTVAQFTQFIRATGYRTESERIGWSGVFNVNSGRWERVEAADWQHPEGPSSSASSSEPVTQVSWNDANAYAKWANKRLPTEAEFEYAARGGLVGKEYAWGNDLTLNRKYMANWWQGLFPSQDLGEDGFVGRAPVGSFPPNRYGLYDITGNVWEWCADWFNENYYSISQAANPQGPPSGEDRVIRGGSWLCSENYCTGYRVAARNHTAPDSGSNNLGFRCARDQ